MISIQNVRMMKITPNLSLRLRDAEFERYEIVAKRALDRHPYIRTADVMRELLGLTNPVILSSVEIDFFRYGGRTSEFDKYVKTPKGELSDETKKPATKRKAK